MNDPVIILTRDIEYRIVLEVNNVYNVRTNDEYVHTMHVYFTIKYIDNLSQESCFKTYKFMDRNTIPNHIINFIYQLDMYNFTVTCVSFHIEAVIAYDCDSKSDNEHRSKLPRNVVTPRVSLDVKDNVLIASQRETFIN